MGWWALISDSGKALQARDELARGGFGVFCPVERQRQMIKLRGRKQYHAQWHVRPIFGRYIFASGAEAELRMVRGIADIVRAGQVAISVPDRVISCMRQLTTFVEGYGDVMGERDLTAMRSGFFGKTGDIFRFSGGCFSGYYGVISSLEKLDSSGTISAYVEIFGAKREIEVAREMVKPLSAAERAELEAA